MATPPETDSPQQPTPMQADLARKLAAARKMSDASTQLMGAARDAMNDDLSAPTQMSQAAEAARGIMGIHKQLLGQELLQGGHTEGHPDVAPDMRLAANIGERTSRFASAIASGNEMQAQQFALLEGKKIAQELTTAIESGSFLGQILALIVAAALDFFEALIALSTVYVGAAIMKFATVPLKTFLYTIYWFTMPGYGKWWRKRILRILIGSWVLEEIPGGDVLPIETLTMLWILNDASKKRRHMQHQLHHVQRHQNILEKNLRAQKSKNAETTQANEDTAQRAA